MTNGTEVAPAAPAPVISEAEQRLQDLLDRRRSLELAREARGRLTPEEQVAIAERALAADEALDRLEGEHGRIDVGIGIVRVDDERDGRAIILKRPNMTVFRRYQDGKQESKDVDGLVRPCVLWPSKAEFEVLVNELPFLMARCANKVSTLAGVRREDVGSK